LSSAPASYRAVLLNDTAFAAHHGCRRVGAAIRQGLAKHGIAITASSPAGAAWYDDPDMLHELKAADLIVVNGEGTIHHGAEAGARLLRVLDHPARRGRPVAFLNMLWQDNPADWAQQVVGADLVSVRDRRSQQVLEAAGVEAVSAPDFSFYLPIPERGQQRHTERVAFGDSVSRSVSKELYGAYKAAASAKCYLPIRASLRHEPASQRASLKRRFDNLRHDVKARLRRALDGGEMTAPDADSYLSALAACTFHITGRYHAVCFSIATATPFHAVSSNSHKIEALLDDVGVDPGRIRPTVQGATGSPPTPFTESESKAIAAWNTMARSKIDDVFSAVAKLAR
jgi:polysaccharide pyruvyl transferase WcaK-like protein